MLKEQRFSLHYWEICNLQQSFHYLVVLAVIHVHRLGQHPVHGAICSVRVSTDWPSTFHVFFFFYETFFVFILGNCDESEELLRETPVELLPNA
jgi:hypothetical protein